jgi:hypothetical protein
MKLKLIIASVFIGLNALAQNEIDALRYSKLDFASTARQVGLGGAFGALGGDISSLSSNPAGIGVFSQNVLSVNLGLNHNLVQTKHFGTFNEDERFRMNLPNLGVVFDLSSAIKDKNWTKFNIGLAHNNLQTYNNKSYISGENSQSSLGDYALDLANGTHYNDLGTFASIAFMGYLIDTLVGEPSRYYSTTPTPGSDQQQEIEESGRLNETVLSLGGTYKSKLALGASVGFNSILFDRTSQFREYYPDNSTNYAHTVIYDENYTTKGNGVNIKLGFILSPIQWIRIGGAIHSPTWFYNMSDDYYSGMDVLMTDNTANGAESSGEFYYRLRTPARQIGSVAFLYKKTGLLSMEVERVNYGKARLNNKFVGDYKFENENAQIVDQYTSALKLKIGAEWKYGNLVFRGGIVSAQNSYQSQNINDDSSLSYSLGLGLNRKASRIDFAYQLSQRESNTYLYGSDYIDATQVISNQSQFMVAWTFHF